MSKSFSVKYHAAIDTYKAAMALAAARIIVDIAQAKLAEAVAIYSKATAIYDNINTTAVYAAKDAKAAKDAAYAVYIDAEKSVTKAKANNDAAEAAVDEAFDLIAKIRYSEPKQEDE